MSAAFRAPLPSDIQTIGRNMRAIDALECADMAGLFPVEALEMAVAESVFALAAIVEDEPVCVFGVAPETLLGAVGVPWLLGREGFEEHSRDILKWSRPFVDHMLGLYPHLRNVVHTENRHAIRWLRWCGFTVGEELPAGRNGSKYRMFQKKAA